jgi:hypothetical protein
MPLELIYITRDPNVAQIAEAHGVQWIMVDLEFLGKAARQAGKNSVLSNHSLSDVVAVRRAVTTARLLVRVNPLNPSSRDEIDAVVNAGAEMVMLPFFKSAACAASFLELLGGKARGCLLVETPEAVSELDQILELQGVGAVYIGLNDLHLGYKLRFMFEPLANGMLDDLCARVSRRGLAFGFGGIARPGAGLLPAELIIAEHRRLRSTMAILSRTFCDTKNVTALAQVEQLFAAGVAAIRKVEHELDYQPPSFFAQNHKLVCRQVAKIVSTLS